jgi:anthranilate phosphoribosyltransferase
MRHLAAVRRELGVRTVMNCLGPLLNPLGVRNQLVGVYSEDLVLTLAHALRALDAERALVVHGSDGLDELTTTGPNAVAWLSDGVVEARTLDPAELGIPRARPEELGGGDAGENADILRAILDGEAGARADIVVLNAAAALWVSGSAREMREGLEQARESVASGAARASLDKLVRATQEAGEGP